MSVPLTVRRSASEEKRERVLLAARELIPRFGLHNTPMSAIAGEAGVAKGTPYLYFESKEALINSLYLDLLREREGAFGLHDGSVDLPPREAMWNSWSGYTRWHVEHPDRVNLIQQCEASGILTEETLAERSRLASAGLELFSAAVATGQLRDLPLAAFMALFEGPVLFLAQMQAAGEVVVTEELLRVTFEGICRAVAGEALR